MNQLRFVKELLKVNLRKKGELNEKKMIVSKIYDN